MRSIEINVLADFSLTNEEQLVLIAYELKHFLEVNIEIKYAIEFELIADWGYVIDLCSVAIDVGFLSLTIRTHC